MTSSGLHRQQRRHKSVVPSQGVIRTTSGVEGLECQVRRINDFAWFPEEQLREHGIYTHSSGTSRLVIGVYVDFKRDMKRLFSMSDLGLLSYYLGIEVTQTNTGITLC